MINGIKEVIENDIIRIQHKKIKENQINKIVAKKYSIKENQQHKLNHTRSYQSKGLNTVNQNQNIIISQNTLNNAIANLSEVNNDNKQSQTTKNDLVELLFVTSEAMRFGSYRKYFNYEKDDRQVEFKNIPTNVKGILDGKINSLIKWKEYEHQLIRGRIASSKDLEQKRKKIFKKLNEQIIVSNFLSENYQNKEYINVILQYLENLFEASKDEIKFLKTGYKNILKFINTDHNYNLIRSVISEGNLDLLELIITKKSELINANNNDLTFLQVAITNYKIDIVKWLPAKTAPMLTKRVNMARLLYVVPHKTVT